MKENLTMWWAKLLLPLVIPGLMGIIISGCTWVIGALDEQEDRLALIEQNILLIQQENDHEKEIAKEYLNTLKALAKGVTENSKSIIALEGKVNSVVERNNLMIEALLDEVKRSNNLRERP